MKCLSSAEITTWLENQNVTAKPGFQSYSPAYFLQFEVPSGSLKNWAFIRNFLLNADQEVLVHITDWSTYSPAEMEVISAIRLKWGETRILLDAPGHLISKSEMELTVAIFGHTVNCQWSSYLYLPNDSGTFFNWEGELYDYWTDDQSQHSRLIDLAKDMDIQIRHCD